MKSLLQFILEANNKQLNVEKLAELFNDGVELKRKLTKHESIKIHQDVIKAIKDFPNEDRKWYKKNNDKPLILTSNKHTDSLYYIPGSESHVTGWEITLLIPNGKGKYEGYSIYSVSNLTYDQRERNIRNVQERETWAYYYNNASHKDMINKADSDAYTIKVIPDEDAEKFKGLINTSKLKSVD